MKIRFGFISNSSSASFALLGFSIGDADYETIENYDCIYDGEGGAPEGEGCVIGKYLLYARSDDYIANEAFDIEPLIQEGQALHERFGVATPIRLYVGTKTC